MTPVTAAGKSTKLDRQIHENSWTNPREGADRTTARTDPTGLISEADRPLFIDEVQRGGDPLVLTLKAEVDRHPERVGSFVVSGSSRFLTVPTLSESLAGRARIIDLWPLSQGELARRIENFIDTVFDPSTNLRRVSVPVLSRGALFERVVLGGFLRWSGWQPLGFALLGSRTTHVRSSSAISSTYAAYGRSASYPT